MATKIQIQPARALVTTDTDGNAQTRTLELAITPNPANNQLHEYNLPEATSLHPATGLKELFPGLQQRSVREVETQHPAEFLKQNRPEPQPGDELSIISPGEEHHILQALAESGLLTTFTRLSLVAQEEPLYENAQSYRATVDWLQKQGFELKQTNAEDPDWPVWELVRNPLQDTVDVQTQAIEELAKKLEQSEQSRKQAEDALASQREAARKANDDNQRLQQRLEELEASSNQANESVRQAEDARAEAQERQKALEAELDQLRSTLTAQKEQHANAKSALQEKQQELEQLRSTLTAQKEQHANAESALQERQQQLEQSEQGRKQAEEALASQREAARKANGDNQRLQQRLEELKASSNQANESVRQAEDARAEAQERQKALEAELDQLRSTLTAQKEQHANAKSALQEKQQELEQLRSTLTAQKEQQANAKSALQEKQQELEAANQSLEDHKTWFRNRKEQAVTLEKETAEYKQLINKLQTENDTLTRELQSLKQEKQQLLETQGMQDKAFAQLEQKMETLFTQQASQLTQAANALGQHVTRSFADQRQQFQSITGLNQYLESGETPLEYGGWAIGADLAGHLVRAIEQTPYDLVIEFGSGTSTVLMARAIANTMRGQGLDTNTRALESDSQTGLQAPGRGYDLPRRILSFEQDKAYQQKTRSALQQNSLQPLVELVLAPLVPTNLPSQSGHDNALFYTCDQKLANVAGLFEDREAHILVLVDGPFSPKDDPLVREPALACVLQHLSSHKLDIVLDDAGRQGERQVLEYWQQLCEERGLSCEQTTLNTEKGAAWLSIAP
ncbi:hypothetical protein MLC59_09040 [Marinobacter bryozoorum]|uniref:hypothetical protein n=1 Tax=Marinobacter bryozoorum TaxID=256324 RepID=UPI0020036A9A|nr:hypothetical protein [Marinobacter bryozoorum]MCK7544310.1 hypothetical protein [Marinobacter bryozoorum]